MLEHLLNDVYFHNRVIDYVLSAVVFVSGFACVKIFKSVVLMRLKTWAEKTEGKTDDFVVMLFDTAFSQLMYFGVFYSSVRALKLHPFFSRFLDIAGLVFVTLFAVKLFLGLIEHALEDYWTKKEKEKHAAPRPMPRAFLALVKGVFWGFGVIFLLDNLGFKISTVVAGLGIGGVAIALASQTVLGDLFNYFVILFDRPFEIGDFVIVGDLRGAVEHIGIKTTRIRSLEGEQLVFSNTDLTNSRIKNYKRMEKRRVVFQIGATYETKSELLRDIPPLLSDIVNSQEDTALDRAHFCSYGDFSLNFEVVYFVLSGDYNRYMDIHQKINFRIKEEFEKRGIEFAYPTQTLYVRK